jgi:hypothetical protein
MEADSHRTHGAYVLMCHPMHHVMRRRNVFADLSPNQLTERKVSD